MTEPRTIGFLGLGLMGRGFTRRLTGQGYRVLGYDIAADKVEAARAWGVEPADSPAEVARGVDVVLVCVTTTSAVEEALLGPTGVVEAAPREGLVVVDHSTTEMDVTRRIGEALAEKGIAFVDAPVSGGPGAAETGTLAIMAGGDDAAISRIRPLMDRLASRFTAMGPIGAGQATKLVNQILVLTNYCILAEAHAMGQRLGVDVAKIPEALATGHAGSNLLRDLFPRMVERDFAPRGYARQVLKDLHLLAEEAKHLNLAMPMATQAAMLYRMLIDRGGAELDGAAIVTLYDGQGGT